MKKASHRTYNSKLQELHRKELRNSLTPAEALLWSQLKQRQLGKKFRRQYSVGPYILDFYCPEIRLAVELDGEGHFLFLGAEKDGVRDAYLAELGITVLRFENELVHRELEWVVGTIREKIRIIS